VAMIGPSVHLVRLLDTRVFRSVASAGVPVGCLSAIEIRKAGKPGFEFPALSRPSPFVNKC
jgi:hypothetical protein